MIIFRGGPERKVLKNENKTKKKTKTKQQLITSVVIEQWLACLHFHFTNPLTQFGGGGAVHVLGRDSWMEPIPLQIYIRFRVFFLRRLPYQGLRAYIALLFTNNWWILALLADESTSYDNNRYARSVSCK